jgi:hypothetical protein
MKNQAIALGAALLFAAPFATPALADPTGFISIGAGPSEIEIDNSSSSDTFNLDGYALEALLSGSIMLTPVLGIQGDVRFTSRTLEESGNDITTNSFDGALHGFYRESDKFLVGGFVQIGRDDVSYNSTSEGKIDRAYVGGEAQVYLDNLTLYGQAGMQQLDFGGGSSMSIGLNGWFANAEVRYFLTPNLRIEARAGFSTLDFEILSATFDTVTIGAGVEYKLDSLPLSLFAKYDYSTTSAEAMMSSDATIGSHRFLVGARFALGEDSLLDRDRNGASLRPVQADNGFLDTFGGFGGGSPPP